MAKQTNIDLIGTFDGQRYPHKHLMSAVKAAPIGLLSRVMTAIENLGIDAKFADKHIDIHDRQEGGPKYLLAIATKTPEDYQAIVTEIDRIEAGYQTAWKQETEATKGMTHEELLKHDYLQQVQYEGPNGEEAIIDPRADLLADYAAQPASELSAPDDDNLDTGDIELEENPALRDDLLADYAEQRRWQDRDKGDDYDLSL